MLTFLQLLLIALFPFLWYQHLLSNSQLVSPSSFQCLKSNLMASSIHSSFWFGSFKNQRNNHRCSQNCCSLAKPQENKDDSVVRGVDTNVTYNSFVVWGWQVARPTTKKQRWLSVNVLLVNVDFIDGIIKIDYTIDVIHHLNEIINWEIINQENQDGKSTTWKHRR